MGVTPQVECVLCGLQVEGKAGVAGEFQAGDKVLATAARQRIARRALAALTLQNDSGRCC